MLALLLLAAAPTFTGSKACAECHRDQYEKQAGTAHATALRPFQGSELAERLLRQGSVGDGAYRHVYVGSRATTSAGGESASMQLEWTFGSGSQAYTAVGRAPDGGWIEHRISFYTAAPARFSLTPGHFGRTLASPADALGIPQDGGTIRRCFNCHATAVSPDLSQITAGVQCERCHGPGSDHVAAASAKDAGALRKTILNSGRFTARASVMVCGECHRTPPARGSSPTPELDDPLSVRFQPVGLMASRCFQASGKLSCLTCHDAHEPLRRDDAVFYTGRCLSCHTAPAAAGTQCRRSSQHNCLPCHMEKTSPAPHLSFTDHRIRLP
jgi:hypothetical protein